MDDVEGFRIEIGPYCLQVGLTGGEERGSQEIFAETAWLLRPTRPR